MELITTDLQRLPLVDGKPTARVLAVTAGMVAFADNADGMLTLPFENSTLKVGDVLTFTADGKVESTVSKTAGGKTTSGRQGAMYENVMDL